jgi:putative addiction module component (TIGR02574 family)
MTTASTVPMSEAVQRLVEASQTLTVTERIDLVRAIWDTVPVPADWKPSPEVLDEIHRRRNELRRSPESGISAEEMDRRLV